MATGDSEDMDEDVDVDSDEDDVVIMDEGEGRSGDQPVAPLTPAPPPAQTPSDEDFEINQEKVMEPNVLCNIPILAVQKSAECNANVEQANCEAMGMRTNEQGQCEDIDIFGATPVPTPLVVEEGTPVDNKPSNTGEGGDSETSDGGHGGSSEDNAGVAVGGDGGHGGDSEDNTNIGEGGDGGHGGDVEDNTNID